MVTVAKRRPTDDHLGEATAGGDAEAFSALYQRHFRGVYDFALRLVRDPEAAAQVVCESFTASWRALRKRPVPDVKASLYVECFRAGVERAARAKIPPADAADFAALDTGRLAAPAAVHRDPDLPRRVWEAAAALGARDYGLLDLQLRKALPVSELAAELGVRRAALDARIARLKDELVQAVAAAREDTAPQVSPLAVFAALAPHPEPPGARDAVWARILEHAERPPPRRWKPTPVVILVAGVALTAATGGAVLALALGGGPRDPTGFRSTTHNVGVETSDTTIAVSWLPESEATGYSVLWSHEPTLPDETVDLAGTTAQTTRLVTPGQWWFNLRTRDGDGDWTHTVHVGPFVIVPVPNTTLASRPAKLSNDARGVFGLEATGEGSFECSLDGARFERCEARAVTGPIRDGRHRFAARVRDRYGNADPSPAVWVWRVDTKRPRARIVSIVLDGRTAAFRFSARERNAMFECRMDEGEYRRCRSPLSVRLLSQGTHVFFVRAIDAAGNRDRSPASYRWSVDTRAPRTNILSGPSGVVHRAKATFVLGANESSVTFECSLDGTAFAACPSTITIAGLESGEHTFAARAKDGTGNVDRTPARREWRVIDDSAPQTTITGHPRVSSGDTSPTFRFRSAQAGSTFECRLDSGSWRSCSSPKTYNGLSAGQHVFRVRSRDGSGNVDHTPASWTWTIH